MRVFYLIIESLVSSTSCLKITFVCLRILPFLLPQMYVSYITYSKDKIVTTDK